MYLYLQKKVCFAWEFLWKSRFIALTKEKKELRCTRFTTYRNKGKTKPYSEEKRSQPKQRYPSQNMMIRSEWASHIHSVNRDFLGAFLVASHLVLLRLIFSKDRPGKLSR